MKIVDCFIFYNELDLLNYRLNILNDYVDYFVIVESTHSFAGNPKTLFYSDNKHLFEKFNEKIVHIVVDDFPYKYPNINYIKNQQWENDRFQRNAISRGINILNLSLDDVLIITDLDEIPNPDIIDKIKKGEIIINIHSLEMDLYYYNLYTKKNFKWIVSKILSYEKYNELKLTCNEIRYLKCRIIENGGWHLSYFGDSKFIANKIKNASHQEFNNKDYTDTRYIEHQMNNYNCFLFKEHMGKLEIKDNNNLPIDYETYLTKFF